MIILFMFHSPQGNESKGKFMNVETIRGQPNFVDDFHIAVDDASRLW
jgi:hypothetical protein